MNVLRLHAYRFPEITASLHLINDLDEALIKNDIDSVVITPTPTRGISKSVRKAYKKKKLEILHDGKLTIKRFSMVREGKNPLVRAFRYFACNFVQYQKAIKEKDVDVLFSSSTPPTQGWMCGKVKQKLEKKYKKKVPFVFNVQDIFPDSLITTGLSKKKSLAWKIGMRIANSAYKQADKIIVISESMKQNLLDKGVPQDKLVVVSNWINIDEVKPVAKENNALYSEYKIDPEKFTVLYAGNFGEAQGAGVVLDAAEILKDCENIQFVIFGGGANFEKAKKRVADEKIENVIINPLLPQDRVSEVYSLGDIALITCKKGVGTSGMPSKTWSIMACNTPIIAAFDTEGDLADTLKAANAGLCVEPENAEALSAAILAAAENPIKDCGAREYVEKYASKEICTAKYVEVIKNCVEN